MPLQAPRPAPLPAKEEPALARFRLTPAARKDEEGQPAAPGDGRLQP